MTLRDEALDYHCLCGKPGKISVESTKPLETQADLSLAYTPGVAEPVKEIMQNPDAVYQYTSKGNLVAVISNGTAILGLGNQGALASKPVMEGKGVLFKKFAGVDVFDIEVDELDPDAFIKIVAGIAPTFGGINLEDIKSPECFYIEKRLQELLDIPVFHDDQHGTAIVLGAAFLNALEVVGKMIDNVKVVFSGAGAAAIACAKHLLRIGVPLENIWMCDLYGLVYAGRQEEMFTEKMIFTQGTQPATLGQVIAGADVFIGLSAANVLKPEMVLKMNPDPIIFAMANPNPEIDYNLAKQTRPDVVIATGRSDYPNQINNVLCFPFLFRGALDVRAREINDEMKMAASQALAALAHEPVPEDILKRYGISEISFGRDYLLPKALDKRVCLWVASAVAQAAMQSGVARIRVEMDAYRGCLIESYG
ncbi:MAG: malic enzyme [Chloroflexi bacterium HGW-Chloroflexi-2]|jgi:malate dehydrogenase (oxaloacetate-decarboxylating)(NADP+)|nr:MAG: malic enzyme [Chloroflexi bacterium HGW-Chloroflexi-2]